VNIASWTTNGLTRGQARETHPILARYHNNWATEAIVKQYVKNKRNNAYKNNWLEVPAKYTYLKANAAKWNPMAPHGRQNKLAHAAVAKKKAVRKAAASGSKKVASGSKKAKGKSKAVIPSDSNDNEELSNYEDDKGMEEDDD
jgi:hypothetical protein